MSYLIVGAVCLVVGIFIGAAIWRNNAKKFSELEKKGLAAVDALKK
jgi:uncharacterized membrane-anchored protein YhcB (DUF1043 family)